MALVDNKAKIQALIAGINALPEAGGGEAPEPSLQEKTVTPATSVQSVTPDSGYDGLSKVTVNAMPSATQATPSIEVSPEGLITASATQSAGYVAAGTKSATKQLETQAAQTITPGTSDKTIAAGKYLTGVQTIKGDANLKADNITEGVSIFGVAGANPYEKTATTTEVNTQASKLAQLKIILEGKAAGGGGITTKTCKLAFDFEEQYGSNYEIGYVSLQNGTVHYDYHMLSSSSTELELVLCDSVFVISYSDDSMSGKTIQNVESSAGYVEFLYDYHAAIALDGVNDGETVTITLEVG